MAIVVLPNGTQRSNQAIGSAINQAMDSVQSPKNGVLIATYTRVIESGGSCTISGPGGVANVIAEAHDNRALKQIAMQTRINPTRDLDYVPDAEDFIIDNKKHMPSWLSTMLAYGTFIAIIFFFCNIVANF